MDALYAAARQLSPALVPAEEGDVLDTEQLIVLYQELATAYPQAGKVYWGNRLWALMYWQPVYLSICAVHGQQTVINFDRYQQFRQPLSIYGFKPLEMLDTKDYLSIETAIDLQAEQLKSLLRDYLSVLSSICRISITNAWGLVADALLLVLKRQPISDSDKLNYAQLWLNRLQLTDKQGRVLSALSYAPGTTTPLLLNRRSCCMHYLRDRADICSSCPKQPQSERWQRMLQAQ